MLCTYILLPYIWLYMIYCCCFAGPVGVKKLTTETGAGQWGSALAFATCLMDMQCEVWQVRASYDSKPYRKTIMETW